MDFVESGFYGGPNARLFSRDGALLERFKLGDGIAHVATDASDRIWVGWHDEGIYEHPPSRNGLGCFDVKGAPSSLPDWPFLPGFLIACYALNVTEYTALTCFYSHVDFRLIQVRPRQPVQWWKTELSGASAIARDGMHALIAGGYGDDANRLALVLLDGPGQGEDVRVIAQWTLPLRRLPPSTNEWAPVWDHPTVLIGRGDLLHLIYDGDWYVWRVSDLMTSR